MSYSLLNAGLFWAVGWQKWAHVQSLAFGNISISMAEMEIIITKQHIV